MTDRDKKTRDIPSEVCRAMALEPGQTLLFGGQTMPVEALQGHLFSEWDYLPFQSSEFLSLGPKPLGQVSTLPQNAPVSVSNLLIEPWSGDSFKPHLPVKVPVFSGFCLMADSDKIVHELFKISARQ